MTDTKELHAKGSEIFAKVYCGDLEAPPKGEDEFMDLMIENLFAQIWSKETLSMGEKRLFLMGMIAGQGASDLFSFQASCALRNEELSADAIRDMIIMATQYVGYPKASALRIATDAVLNEAG